MFAISPKTDCPHVRAAVNKTMPDILPCIQLFALFEIKSVSHLNKMALHVVCVMIHPRIGCALPALLRTVAGYLLFMFFPPTNTLGMLKVMPASTTSKLTTLLHCLSLTFLSGAMLASPTLSTGCARNLFWSSSYFL